jgi:hypothetical protein
VRADGGEDPYEGSERVRELILHPEEERETYQNKGLFSDDYLKHRLTNPGQYPEWRDDVSRAREQLLGLYESKKYLCATNDLSLSVCVRLNSDISNLPLLRDLQED